jgi:hypothetical protein
VSLVSVSSQFTATEQMGAESCADSGDLLLSLLLVLCLGWMQTALVGSSVAAL